MQTFASVVKDILRAFRRAWWWLRQVTGDASYENYLRSAARRHTPACPDLKLGAREFYLDQLRRRYSRPSRCC
jgi:uncharacterized short protein YbdD (DUF466 family)